MLSPECACVRLWQLKRCRWSTSRQAEVLLRGAGTIHESLLGARHAGQRMWAPCR